MRAIIMIRYITPSPFHPHPLSSCAITILNKFSR